MPVEQRDLEPDPDAIALAEELRVAIGSLVRAVRNDTGTPKSAQSETLGLLDREGAMNIATLAYRRQVKHQTMRSILAQLEAAGMVGRSVDPDDRRSQVFALTEAGRDELARGRAARASGMGAIIQESFSIKERKLLRAAVALLVRIGTAHHGRSPPSGP